MTTHMLTKPFTSRKMALAYSVKMLHPTRLHAYGLAETDRVIAVVGGFAALFSPRADGVRIGDVFHGARGAATRRQLVEEMGEGDDA